MVRIRTLTLFLALTALLVPEGAAAEPATRIIVKREPGLTAAERADVRADAGVRLVETLSLPRTEVVSAPSEQARKALRELNADPDVAYAELDRPIRAFSDDPDFGYLWGLENLGDFSINSFHAVQDADLDVPEAWSLSTGLDQTVAVVDSGVDGTHPDLVDRVVPGWDFVENDADTADTNGHGTHVSGTIAATKDNQEGVAGVAPEANVLPLRVLDADGTGDVSDAISAFDYAGAPDVAPIVNASFGGDGFVQAEYDAIARNSDTLFVIAAGNDGNNNDIPAQATFPCAYDLPNILCVGASRHDDNVASFSNYGATTVDVFAPGYGIYSTLPAGEYGWADGTSMATPHVAGAAALVLDAAPDLTPVEVKDVLMQTGDYKSAFGGRSVSGRRVNAKAAVDLALSGGPLPDSDKDGFSDSADGCPFIAASDLPTGCPDRDHDGVTDGSDNCPTIANAGQANSDGRADGGDACDTDLDNDGKPNSADLCDTLYGTGANGCPPMPPVAADSDHDGVANASDGCPYEPAATNDGCPIPAVAALTAKVKRCGRGRCATVRVQTSRVAMVRVTLERKRCSKGRCRWVRVMRKTTSTSRNVATVRSERLPRGRYRAVVVVSSSAGRARPETDAFRVR
jgi:subtilisin family serine protease